MADYDRALEAEIGVMIKSDYRGAAEGLGKKAGKSFIAKFAKNGREGR